MQCCRQPAPRGCADQIAAARVPVVQLESAGQHRTGQVAEVGLVTGVGREEDGAEIGADRRRLRRNAGQRHRRSGSKGEHYATIESDYRWEKGDEVWIEARARRLKMRITWVHVTVTDTGVSRELLGLKL